MYNPGTEPEDIMVPAGGPFINDPVNQFYLGLNPAGGPLGTAPTPGGGDNHSNARNRVESVSFPVPGTYLVICNVRGHFNDGMFAFTEVKGGDDDDD